MSDLQRLILAITLSLIIVFAWQHFFVTPLKQQEHEANAPVGMKSDKEESLVEEKIYNRTELIEEGFKDKTRIKISNSAIEGSINLVGGRIDDLSLLNYKTSYIAGSSEVVLFSPSTTEGVYFAEFGWVADNKDITLPTKETLWKSDKNELSASETIKLTWMNPQKIEFVLEFALDNDYMFEVKQKIKNHSGKEVKLQPYALLSRTHIESDNKNIVIHEGGIAVLNDTLSEYEYKDLQDKNKIMFENQTGWTGFSDKYWLAALIPSTEQKFKGNFIAFKDGQLERYQTDIALPKLVIENGKEVSKTIKLFAGAKKLELLDKYQEKYDIKLFDRAVDFGILYFITKPLFILLSYFYKILGNFGVAILLLTVVIKILLFPLAFKAFKGLNRLKDLQPQMVALKEKYQKEPLVFQKSVMELYKKERVNPLAGCLPILLQMPIFFALYKVLYVTIEMRHAPFFGWIKDLSAADPTSLFNLFGLIPWDPPAFLYIGVLPILMATTMYVQQRLSPEPSDPVQAKVMKMLPWIFMFMFASFPSGLIVYWAWSNLLSIIQQVAIKKLDKKREN
jgi:YidC/Oxa1 family membrane protein insertase